MVARRGRRAQGTDHGCASVRGEVRLVARAAAGHRRRNARPPRSSRSSSSLWSSGYVVGAVAIDVADPLPLLAARFVLASLVAVPLALRRGRWRGAPLGRLAVAGLLLQVVQFGGVYGGFALGVPAALSALVMLGLSPARHDRPRHRDRPGARRRAAVGRARRRRRRRRHQPRARARQRPRRRRDRRDDRRHARAGERNGAAEALGRRRRPARRRGRAQSVTGGADRRARRPSCSAGASTSRGSLVALVGWLGLGHGIATLLLLVHVLRGHAASTVAALLLIVPAGDGDRVGADARRGARIPRA